MSAIDTAKEFVRLGSTVGLSKDVIDLLDKKAVLLAEQVATLEQENTTLLRENRNLKLENEKLNGQLQNARPKGELSEQTTAILKSFFTNARELSEEEIARHFQIGQSIASYHLDILLKKRFIGNNAPINFGGGGRSRMPKYEITSEGRAYCIESGLAD